MGCSHADKPELPQKLFYVRHVMGISEGCQSNGVSPQREGKKNQTKNLSKMIQ